MLRTVQPCQRVRKDEADKMSMLNNELEQAILESNHGISSGVHPTHQCSKMTAFRHDEIVVHYTVHAVSSI